MIPCLKEDDAVVLYDVDDPVFEAQPPGPDIGAEILESLRLTESGEWVSLDVQDEIENARRVSFISLDPILKILEKLRPEG